MSPDRPRRCAFLILALLCLSSLTLLSPQNVSAADAHNGGVDWGKKRLWAKGMGVAPADTPERLAGPMAERAALLDARRNLVEVLEQIYVDSQTTVSDFVTSDDTVRNRVYGVLSRPDVDSVDIDKDGVCEMVVSVPIDGELAEALKARMPQNSVLPADTGKITQPRRIAGTSQQKEPAPQEPQGVHVAKITQPERINPQQEQPAAVARQNKPVASEPQPEPVPVQSSEPQKTVAAPPPVVGTAPATPEYTGLVVDARELGFTPSLTPQIFASDILVYPAADMRPDVVSSGLVRYYRSLEQAQQGSMAGTLPLTIKASGLHDNNTANLELNTDDGALLQSISKTPGSFLNAGRVAIVF